MMGCARPPTWGLSTTIYANGSDRGGGGPIGSGSTPQHHRAPEKLTNPRSPPIMQFARATVYRQLPLATRGRDARPAPAKSGTPSHAICPAFAAAQ